MSRETEFYERGWDVCVRCGTRRPVREMEYEVDGWVCRDRLWCQKQRTREVPEPEQEKPD